MRITPISFSSIKNFQGCPKRYHWEKTHARTNSHSAAEWGTAVHKAIEDTLNGCPLTPEYEQYSEYCTKLNKIKGKKHVEHKLCVDDTFQPCDWDAPDAYFRGILDFLSVRDERALLIDHKTGKKYPTDQLYFNSLLIFAHFPEVQEITAIFSWLQTDETTTYTYNRSQMAEGMRMVDNVVFAIQMAEKNKYWPPQPSGLCAYCPVRTCQFNKVKEEPTDE